MPLTAVTAYDWPLPARAIARPVLSDAQATLRLAGQDLFFGANGQAPAHAFPNPVILPAALKLRTYDYDEPLRHLRGFDSLYGEQGEVPAYDYPNPRAYGRSRALLSGQNSRVITFDQIYGAAGEAPAYDWPNPTLPVVKRQSYAAATRFDLIGRDSIYGAPGQAPNYVYTVPSGPTRSIELRSHVSQVYIPALPRPFDQNDWPNPIRAYARQDYNAPSPVRLAGQDVIFGQAGESPTYDYPNPQRPRQPNNGYQAATPYFILPPTVSYDYQNPVVLPLRYYTRYQFDAPLRLLGADLIPFPNRDWLNPAAYRRSLELRTHADAKSYLRIGQDALFGANGEVPEYDYPNPRLRLRTVQPEPNVPSTLYYQPLPSGHAFVSFPLFPVRRQAPDNASSPPYLFLVPVGPYEYSYRPTRPLSSGYVHATDLTLLGRDVIYGQAGQAPSYVLPNPAGYPFPAQARAYAYAFPLTLPGQDRIYAALGEVPSYDYPNPRPYARAVELLTALARRTSLLAGQDAIYGQPGQAPAYTYYVPAPYPNSQTWRHYSQNIANNLIGKDSFYGQPGQAPVYVLPNPNLPYVYFRRVMDFVRNADTGLFGKDVMYGAPGQAPTYEFQIALPPKGYPFPPSLRGRMDYDYIKVTLSPPPTPLTIAPLVISYELVSRAMMGIFDDSG